MTGWIPIVTSLVSRAAERLASPVVETSLQGFARMLAPVETGSKGADDTAGRSAQGAQVATPAGAQLRRMVASQVAKRELAAMWERVRNVLAEQDLKWDAPLDLQWDGERLAVDGGRNDLAASIAARIEADPEVVRAMARLARLIGTDGEALRVRLGPDGEREIVP